MFKAQDPTDCVSPFPHPTPPPFFAMFLLPGVDIEAARKEEERIMLRDARQWLNSGQINDVRHAKSGGTAMHVAAAKGYTEVLK